MALTLAYRGPDQLKGPYQGNPAATPLHIMRGILNVSGTYVTGGNQYDFCNFWAPAFTVGNAPAGARSGVTAINILWVRAFGDYYDGTTALDVDNASISLASAGSATSISAASTNNLVTIKLFTGTNGAGGSEVANATALSGDFGVVFAVQLTYGSLGVG